jgi:hypothetical protein
MWDVYLGGLSDLSWRTKLKNEISQDISVFDPIVDGYDDFNENERANETARQLQVMQEKCAVIVFYLNSTWKGHSTLLELGDAVGRGGQVVMCLDGAVKDKEKIERYCEYHGVPVVYTLEELITAVEEYMAELAMVTEDLE